MEIERLKNRVEKLEATSVVKAKRPGPTVVIMKGEPVPPGAGCVIVVKTVEARDALQNGISGGPIDCPVTEVAK